MRPRFYQQLLVVLLTMAVLAIACAKVSEETVRPTASPSRAGPLSTRTPSPETTAHLVTHNQPLGVRWTRDGQAILYAEAEAPGKADSKYLWYTFDVITYKQRRVDSPVRVTPEVWNQLQSISSTRVDTLWFHGAISPSGTHIIYSRAQPGWTQQPGKFDLPPIEIWVAKADGTEASKLGGPVPCDRLVPIIWFSQEKKAVIGCSYEGPPNLYVADVEAHSIARLSEITGFQGSLGFGFFSLSPDETNLAITDQSYTLQTVPLRQGQVRPIAQWGYEPRWSSGSQQVYYLKGRDLNQYDCSAAEIHIYDLSTGADSVLLKSPVIASTGERLGINCAGPFEVSPHGDAAVVWSDGLWLIKWP